ncbi:Imm32 family immunity protein [Tengunoibacter tsumagoiensis]|uniref:Uncharacterized protein n=1 Tax=Tengunoibacter tsumagoiensis TaxID=2014871 RepID=A0A402A4V1_9CHLR|nr:hypothetical protein [Tengunoibacter tsumagoiensis]GCE14130.1 hypothetical protein KTT_39890 [Tengunoibacter tsumagoiensis]
MGQIKITFPFEPKDTQGHDLQLNQVTIDVPDYSIWHGVRAIYENEYSISARIVSDNEFVIQADKGGLITLARHLLTLAQDEVPSGAHIHYDNDSNIDDGSVSFVLDKK